MTEEKNSKSESKEEQPKKEQKNQEQYGRLIECSKKGPEGIKEWNEWRKKNPDTKILLNRANFKMVYLKEANLCSAHLEGARLEDAHLEGAELWGAYLKGANLDGAHLEGINLGGAHLERATLLAAHLKDANFKDAHLERATLLAAHLKDANFKDAHLEGAELRSAHLQGANLGNAKLQGAKLCNANLQGVVLEEANLQRANLFKANLQGACLWFAHLEGARLEIAELQEAKFRGAIVNGSTFFLGCKIDENTDFRETGLENTRIESGTKTLLKYNIRRMNWKDWYTKHRFLQWPVKLFWSISNYGISTLRIVIWFFVLALFSAGLYYILSVVSPPGVVNSLVEGKEGPVQGWLIPFRSIYFSIVTMTTLGFGDMHANCRSFLGHLLLTIQVILGYVLLGAMVTRLAVLFTADGPAGSFTAMDKETKELLAKLKEHEGN